MARLKTLLPQVQRAQGENSPVSQEIKLRVSEANVFARKKDFAQANALLDQVEALLKKPAGAGGADPAAEWKKNLAAWTPAIKAALAAKGPNAPAIAKLLAQAGALSKPGGDMAQALAKLAECHALAVPAPGEGAGEGAPEQREAGAPASGPDTDEARWQARRQAIAEAYQKALKEQPANAGRLRAVLGFADGKAELGDFGKALQGLASLEKLLQAPTGPSGEAAAALRQWQAASTEVRNQLRKVQAAIVKAKDLNSTKAVLRLESVVKNLAFQPSTRQDVVELERWIGDDELIALLDTPNPFGVAVKIREGLLPVLASLKPQLEP